MNTILPLDDLIIYQNFSTSWKLDLFFWALRFATDKRLRKDWKLKFTSKKKLKKYYS